METPDAGECLVEFKAGVPEVIPPAACYLG